MKNKTLLIIVLVFAFFLRFFHCWDNPPSLYWDEVSMGYNAWSVATTGKDEYGEKYPLLFESFQEYKLPGYIYALVPFVRFFGLNELSVRFPSIIAGALAVLAIYLLAMQMFGSRQLSLLSSLLLAVSPWHIQFSRAGFEANIGLTTVIFAVYFLINSIKFKKRLYLGFIFLSLSLYFYNSLRIFTPLFLVFFIYLYWQKLKSAKRQLFIAFLLSSIVFFPLFTKFIQPASLNRFSYVSIFSNPDILKLSIEEKEMDGNSIIARSVHHRYIVYATEILRGYFSHFTTDFLFLGKEPNIRHHVADIGLLYIWQLPFILIGIFVLIKKRHKFVKILLLWIILSPVPACFTQPTPHALRSFLMLPVLIIFTAYGMYFIWQRTRPFIRKILGLFVTFVFILEFASYLHQFYFHYPLYSNREWAYGYKEVFSALKNNISRYDNIYVTGKYWRPYIFALFYLEHPAENFQANISHDHIENIYFGHADYDSSDPYYDYRKMDEIKERLRQTDNSLLIFSPDEKIAEDHVSRIIYDKEGKPLFLFVENRKEKIL